MTHNIQGYGMLAGCLVILQFLGFSGNCLGQDVPERFDLEASTAFHAICESHDFTGVVWIRVPDDQRILMFNSLITAMRTDFAKLKSWSSEMQTCTEQYLSPEHCRGYGSRLSPDVTQGLIQEFAGRFVFKAVIQPEARVFRESDTTRYRTLRFPDRAEYPVAETGPIDERSITTNQEHLDFNYKFPPGTLSVVSSHPAAQQRRHATRVPPETIINDHHGSTIDPKQFFYGSMNAMAWVEYGKYIEAMDDPETREQARAILVERGTRDGESLIRVVVPMGPVNTGTPPPTLELIHSERFSCYPISKKFCPGNDPAVFDTRQYWDWQRISGVCVPVAIFEHWRHNGIDTFRRFLKVVETQVNPVIPEETFSLRALGLATGDLVADEAKRSVFSLQPDGSLARLAGFDEPYIAAEDPRFTGSSQRLTRIGIIIVTALLGLTVVFIVRRKTVLRPVDSASPNQHTPP